MSTAARTATRQRAAHDVLMQIVVRVLNLALGVVVTALLVRTLGDDHYGQWSTLFIVLGLTGYFASFGMEQILIREVAREPELEREWYGAMIMLRLVMLGPVVLLSLGAVVVLHTSHQMLISGVILIATMPFSGIGVIQIVFQVRVDNRVPMLVLTIRSILWGAAVAVIFWRGGDMVELAIAMTATNAIGTIVQVVAARRLIVKWPRPSRRLLGSLLRAGMPLGVAGVLIISYASIDQLIVFTMVGSKAAGLYGAVYNVLNQSHFVPISVMTTLAPVMAASWPADRTRMLRVVRQAAELMAIASLGALAFAIVAAGPLVRLFFGSEFVRAAPVLPVLGAAFVFICFGYINGNVLTVLGLQSRLLRISLIALIFNVAGNLILIPVFGFMAAAWMTLATEVMVCALSMWLILRQLQLPLPRPGRIGRTVLAATLLGAGLGALKLLDAPLAGLILAACVCYPALLFGLRALAMDDVRTLVKRQAVV